MAPVDSAQAKDLQKPLRRLSFIFSSFCVHGVERSIELRAGWNRNVPAFLRYVQGEAQPLCLLGDFLSLIIDASFMRLPSHLTEIHIFGSRMLSYI